jgi:hypothetical protein
LARSVWSAHQNVPDFLRDLFAVLEEVLGVVLGHDGLEYLVSDGREDLVGVVLV